MAAAGNCVGFVVAPASYDDALAAAATNAEKRPWRGSSHGTKVALAAPGEDVYVARRTEPDDASKELVEPSDGTSYAVATIAGAAALWVAFHGRDALEAAQGGATRQALFARALQLSAVAPPGWKPSEYGVGILDAERLLRVLPASLLRGRRIERPLRTSSRLELLARTTGVPSSRLAPQLEAWFGGEAAEVVADRWGAELLVSRRGTSRGYAEKLACTAHGTGGTASSARP